MTRRGWLSVLMVLPVPRSLDFVRVTVRVDGVKHSWWEPGAMAEDRYRRMFALLRDMFPREA